MLLRSALLSQPCHGHVLVVAALVAALALVTSTPVQAQEPTAPPVIDDTAGSADAIDPADAEKDVTHEEPAGAPGASEGAAVSADSAGTPEVDGPDVTTPPGDFLRLHELAEAETEYAGCLSLVERGAEGDARACLERLIEERRGTTAALKATGSLRVLRLRAPSAPTPGFEIPAGRLELSSVAGLFGVWNGIAGGIIVALHAPELPPAVTILGTGALAVGLGVAYGIGGYYLADALDLGEGDSRLVASSLVWGSTFGIALIPALTAIGISGPLGVSLPIATVVLGGFAGGASALAISQFAELTSAEVSLVNTGGWVGALLGLLALPNLGAFNVSAPAAYSATYISIAAAGLGIGALASQMLDVTWGETLLFDLGAVLGTVAAGTLVFSLNASGLFAGLPGTVAVPLTTGSIAAGTLFGLTATGVGLALFRGPERLVWKLADLDVELVPGSPSFVLDQSGELVFVAPGPGLRF